MVAILCLMAVGGMVIRRLGWDRPTVVADLPGTQESVNSHEPELQALIAQHRAAVTSSPNDAARWATLGLVYEANHFWSAAYACFVQAARLDPSEPQWLHHSAAMQWQVGEFESALETLIQAVERHPNFAPLRHRLGYALLYSGRTSDAESEFRSGLSLTPDSCELLAGLGDALIRQQKYGEAVAILERAVTLDAQYKTTFHLLGLAYRGLDRREDAERALSMGLDAKVRFLSDEATLSLPQFIRGSAARIAHAGALLAEGRVAEAVSWFETALHQKPDDVTTMIALAGAHQRMGAFESALEILGRAAQVETDNGLIYASMVEPLLWLKRNEEALAQADRAVAAGPELGAAHVARGRALLALERYGEAREALITSLAFDARNPQIIHVLGTVCAQVGLFDEARRHLEAAARRMPNELQPQLDLCRIHLHFNDVEEAEMALQRARRIQPDDVRVMEYAEQLSRLRNQ